MTVPQPCLIFPPVLFLNFQRLYDIMTDGIHSFVVFAYQDIIFSRLGNSNGLLIRNYIHCVIDAFVLVVK